MNLYEESITMGYQVRSYIVIAPFQTFSFYRHFSQLTVGKLVELYMFKLLQLFEICFISVEKKFNSHSLHETND